MFFIFPFETWDYFLQAFGRTMIAEPCLPVKLSFGNHHQSAWKWVQWYGNELITIIFLLAHAQFVLLGFWKAGHELQRNKWVNNIKQSVANYWAIQTCVWNDMLRRPVGPLAIYCPRSSCTAPTTVCWVKSSVHGWQYCQRCLFVDTLKRIVNICNLLVKQKDESCRQQGRKSLWIVALVSLSLLCWEQKCPITPVLFFLHKEATYIDLECYFILVPHFSCHRSHL